MSRNSSEIVAHKRRSHCLYAGRCARAAASLGRCVCHGSTVASLVRCVCHGSTVHARQHDPSPRMITQPAEAAPMPQTSIALFVRWPLCAHPLRSTRLRRSDGACDTAQPCTRVNTIERKNTTKKFRSVSTSALQNLPVGTPCRSDSQSQFPDAWPGFLAKFLMDGCRPWCHSGSYSDPPRLCNALLIFFIEILGRNSCFS